MMHSFLTICNHFFLFFICICFFLSFKTSASCDNTPVDPHNFFKNSYTSLKTTKYKTNTHKLRSSNPHTQSHICNPFTKKNSSELNTDTKHTSKIKLLCAQNLFHFYVTFCNTIIVSITYFIHYWLHGVIPFLE